MSSKNNYSITQNLQRGLTYTLVGAMLSTALPTRLNADEPGKECCDRLSKNITEMEWK